MSTNNADFVCTYTLLHEVFISESNQKSNTYPSFAEVRFPNTDLKKPTGSTSYRYPVF